MKTSTSSSGKCNLCSHTFGKTAMARHVSKCKNPDHPEGSGIQSFHVLVEGGYPKIYWLHLAVPQTLPLSKLDKFLREIWLECCGHMSAFTIDHQRYAAAPMDDGFGLEERSMNVPVGRVLRVGSKFIHEYDYGSTTEISLQVLGEVESFGKPKEIRLLARNDAPQLNCVKCDAPGTQVCSQCSWQEESWLCDKCAQNHECGEETLLPVVNSPRVGVCAYAG
jgi:hypothetical protein